MPRQAEMHLIDPLHPLWNDSSDETTGIFGLPFELVESSLVIVPVPWDAACSQGTGTADAPELVLESSRYVELHDPVLGNIYERGICMAPAHPEIVPLLEQARSLSVQRSETCNPLDRLNKKLNKTVQQEISNHLAMGQATGLLGGDHSVSFGSMAAHRQAFPEMGILQIDAHADLRPSLDGMTWSHASVMWHVMEQLKPVSLTQVGIRAICSVEQAYQASNTQVKVFTDHEMQMRLASSHSWLAICDDIIDALPPEIYLTLDIDGLAPSYCPNTGTPVPGGLSFTQVILLLHRIIESGRIVRGFDLVEIGGHSQDALIAAHLLYTLCGIVENRVQFSPLQRRNIQTVVASDVLPT